ncbi:hypothetical protein PMAYCL1PPCAC_25562, partial [Pristionchus mayeri]
LVDDILDLHFFFVLLSELSEEHCGEEGRVDRQVLLGHSQFLLSNYQSDIPGIIRSTEHCTGHYDYNRESTHNQNKLER